MVQLEAEVGVQEDGLVGVGVGLQRLGAGVVAAVARKDSRTIVKEWPLLSNKFLLILEWIRPLD